MNRLLGLSLTCLLLSPPAWAERRHIETQIVSVSDDVLYVDASAGSGLAPGDQGFVRRKGVVVVQAEVLQIGATHATLRVLKKLRGVRLKVGESVQFDRTVAVAPAAGAMDKPDITELDRAVLGGQLDAADVRSVRSLPVNPPTSTLKKPGESDDEFVPLLAPAPVRAKAAISNSANIFHGRLRQRGLYQSLDGAHRQAYISRTDSDGAIDRLGGGPWSLSWAGNVSYRGGTTFSSASDYHRARMQLYRLTLQGKMDDGGFAKAGRFIPNELSGLGYVDGAQWDHPVNAEFRIGAVAGARPDPRELEPSARQWMGSAYTTWGAGSPGELYYSGTWGVMQTLWTGHADELAVMADQRADITSKLNLTVNGQMNADVGGAAVRHGTRLTRLDAVARSPLTSWLSLRSGANHYERPDTRAERDLSGFPGADWNALFDNGLWRYFVGTGQSLPWDWYSDQELSWQNTAGGALEPFWLLTLGHRGLWWLASANLSATLFNVNSIEGSGYGSQLSAFVPLGTERVTLQLSGGLRDVGQDNGPKRVKLNDVSGYLHMIANRHWQFDLGMSQAYQSHLQSTTADASITYRW